MISQQNHIHINILINLTVSHLYVSSIFVDVLDYGLISNFEPGEH